MQVPAFRTVLRPERRFACTIHASWRAFFCSLGSALLGALIACGASAQVPPHEGDCRSRLERQLPLLPSQSYEQFDQTEGAGFRLLAEAGCFVEAAQLIDSYADYHRQRVELLRWHAAQMLAKAGLYEAAIDRAQQALLKKDRAGFGWNDYVRGTIAFLQRDKAALIRHRDLVAEAAAGVPANQPNLRILDRLLVNFDQPYAVAVSAAP
jgi:hypothetical protein